MAHRRVVLLGLEIDNLAEQEVIDHIVARLQQRQGGRVATPNVDILRLTTVDEDVRRVVAGSDLVVADGVPLLWLARLARQPLRGRVSGANLIYSVSAVAARAGASIYLLGGPPGAAQRAGEELQQQYPGLRVVGTCCPGLGFESSPETLQPVVAEVAAARPDIVFCGLGFPKQERVAEALQSSLPAAWFIGCGAAIAFAAGDLPRAPQWMQRNGLEWLHRLAAEPKRLFRRYVIQDLPFFVVLLAWYLLRYVCPLGAFLRAASLRAEEVRLGWASALGAYRGADARPTDGWPPPACPRWDAGDAAARKITWLVPGAVGRVPK
ncbi:MAG: WecB/TagA/CpsF family glycosyltransferase [Frankiaceae bacterium]